jgi:hypothetical protein
MKKATFLGIAEVMLSQSGAPHMKEMPMDSSISR